MIPKTPTRYESVGVIVIVFVEGAPSSCQAKNKNRLLGKYYTTQIYSHNQPLTYNLCDRLQYDFIYTGTITIGRNR